MVKDNYLGLHLKKLIKKNFNEHFDEYIRIGEKKVAVGQLLIYDIPAV